jgi:hypothetical protein
MPKPMLSWIRLPLTSTAPFPLDSSAPDSASSVLDPYPSSSPSSFNLSSSFSTSNLASAAAALSSLPLLLPATLGFPPRGPLRPISNLILVSSSSPKATPFFPNFLSTLRSLCSLHVNFFSPSVPALFLFLPLLLNVPPQSPSTSLPSPTSTMFPAWSCRRSNDLPDPQNPSPVYPLLHNAFISPANLFRSAQNAFP